MSHGVQEEPVDFYVFSYFDERLVFLGRNDKVPELGRQDPFVHHFHCTTLFLSTSGVLSHVIPSNNVWRLQHDCAVDFVFALIFH